MNNPESDPLAQIDIRSHDLILEFFEHKKEAMAVHPEAEHSTLFEAWAIQKISGLQHTVIQLASRLEELERYRN